MPGSQEGCGGGKLDLHATDQLGKAADDFAHGEGVRVALSEGE